MQLISVALLGALLAVGSYLAVRALIDAPYNADRAAVDAYTAAITPIAGDAGALVVQRIRPELAGFQSGSVTAIALQADAAGWQAAFVHYEARLDAVPHPALLDPTAALFDTALGEYRDAMAGFALAAAAGARDQPDLIARGEALATGADQQWDRGAESLSRLRAQYGLPVSPTFSTKLG